MDTIFDTAMRKDYTFYTQSDQGEFEYSLTAVRNGNYIDFTNVKRQDGQLKDFRSYIDN